MARTSPLLIQTLDGPVVPAGETTARLQGQAVIVDIRLPFQRIGLSWSRPTAVVVEHSRGSSRIPIIDYSRLLVFAAIGAGVAAALGLWAVKGLFSSIGGTFNE